MSLSHHEIEFQLRSCRLNTEEAKFVALTSQTNRRLSEKSEGERALEKRCQILTDQLREKDERAEELRFRVQKLESEKIGLSEEKMILENALVEARSANDTNSSTYLNEMKSLNVQLKEAREALSKYEEIVDSKSHQLDSMKHERERTLFRTGELEEKTRDLEIMVERQAGTIMEKDTALRDATHRLRKVEDARHALELQARELQAVAIKAQASIREGEKGGRAKVQKLEQEVLDLTSRLTDSSTEAAALRQVCLEKEEHLIKYRNQIKSMQEELQRMKEEEYQNGSLKHRLAEAEALAKALKAVLEKERRQRSKWAKARVDLLSQFCQEEHNLHSTLK
jgi:predicted  nucleic acid-binding Zn-ribbon protein